MHFTAEKFSFILSSNRSFLAKFFSLGWAPLQTPIIFMMDHPYDDLNCFSFGGGGSFLLLSLELSKAFPYVSNSIFRPLSSLLFQIYSLWANVILFSSRSLSSIFPISSHFIASYYV